jgi:hypothetical protein
VLTVSISLNQQLAIQAKSYFWTKFSLQPPEAIKTPKKEQKKKFAQNNKIENHEDSILTTFF